MEWCIGLKIRDFFCNGFFGRAYDLDGSTILHAGRDYIVIRTIDNYVISAWFDERWGYEDVSRFIKEWTSQD